MLRASFPMLVNHRSNVDADSLSWPDNVRLLTAAPSAGSSRWAARAATSRSAAQRTPFVVVRSSSIIVCVTAGVDGVRSKAEKPNPTQLETAFP